MLPPGPVPAQAPDADSSAQRQDRSESESENDGDSDSDATVVISARAWVAAGSAAGRDPEATQFLTPTLALPPLRQPEPSSRLPMALAPGLRLHEYRIERVLGQGGFGITYLATDVHLNAQVAIKEYLPQEIAFRAGDRSIHPNAGQHLDRYRQGLDSFLVEARTLATFRHPAIVRVARFFEAHSTAYMVLEYEAGQPFKTWWPEHRHGDEAALVELLLPLLDGLAAVHAAGFLHRDIKPDNIQVRAEDGRLVLLDFGSAGQTLAAAGQGAVVLTPGYAPLEQYGLGQQGAWTDLYALGATLYWVVTGKKPLDAELRAAQPGRHVPALKLCAGRYGQPFLQAIDWALESDSRQRPQSVAELRRALCTEHMARLDLQEALRDGDSPPPGQAQLSQFTRLRQRGARALATLVHPPAWPLAVKMTLAMLATALLPMAVTALYNLRGTRAAVADGELRFVEQMALSSAGRISQFITDNLRLARTLATDASLAAALSSADTSALGDKLERIVQANPDLQRLLLADAQGRVLAASEAAQNGLDLAAEPWFQEAKKGIAHTGDLALSRQDSLAGLMLALPVLGAQGEVLGVLAMRLRGSSLASIVDEVRHDASLTPFLIDRDGVVLHHLQEDQVFSSLMPLPPERQAALREEQRFRRDSISSLNEPVLAAAMVGAQKTGHVAYHSAAQQRDEIAGYAPVAGKDWVVGVSKSRIDFEAPLKPLYTQLTWSVALVGLLFAGLALRFARSIVRPIRALTQAANALKEGQYDGTGVEVQRRDELGQLGRTFNVMIDVLRQRERERRREGG